MPYNTTAIAPRREATGQTELPLSRVKKMIALDNDISMCSSNATFVITLATEMFIQYMAEQGHNVVKSERKPRRNIQYRDLSSAVSRLDNLEFLSDIVPRTVPFKAVKERKIAKSSNAPTSGLNGGSAAAGASQTILDDRFPLVNGSNGHGRSVSRDDGSDGGAGDPNAQLEMEIRSASARRPTSSRGVAAILDNQDAGQDVEMF